MKLFLFLVVKFSIYLNRRVFVIERTYAICRTVNYEVSEEHPARPRRLIRDAYQAVPTYAIRVQCPRYVSFLRHDQMTLCRGENDTLSWQATLSSFFYLTSIILLYLPKIHVLEIKLVQKRYKSYLLPVDVSTTRWMSGNHSRLWLDALFCVVWPEPKYWDKHAWTNKIGEPTLFVQACMSQYLGSKYCDILLQRDARIWWSIIYQQKGKN